LKPPLEISAEVMPCEPTADSVRPAKMPPADAPKKISLTPEQIVLANFLAQVLGRWLR
jgi:hypothetical protein